MQSGISSWFGYKLSLANRLQLIANTGFRVISIWLGEEESLVAAHRTDAMAGMARDARLAIDNFHAPFTRCNLLWSDSSHEQRLIVQEYHAYLAFCRQHDVPILVVHLTHGNPPPPLNK